MSFMLIPGCCRSSTLMARHLGFAMLSFQSICSGVEDTTESGDAGCRAEVSGCVLVDRCW